ncbi:NUDIX hydrolase [Actinomadura geliboluensis]|uniref:NUDIX hydrolase n=1 Tax=Actinomadura geliboluensis TaxID=882440 RepID=A0A5S4H0K1_9ACTN|nr:NUDIX hydrolase [Actinomadura geliboluensis]TMR38221.1 NUDIX hydrolase [Actinomadura geliboluensis]
MTLSSFGRTGQLVSAVVRQGTDILMVRERHGADDVWVLPGGQVEPGELIHDAMVREIREETGLRLLGPISLAYICQYLVEDPVWAGIWTVFTFEVATAPTCNLSPDDPDGLVLEAAWVPVDEAVARLGQSAFRPRREPILHHLGKKSDATAGTPLWVWPDGVDNDPVIFPAQSPAAELSGSW